MIEIKSTAVHKVTGPMFSFRDKMEGRLAVDSFSSGELIVEIRETTGLVYVTKEDLKAIGEAFIKISEEL